MATSKSIAARLNFQHWQGDTFRRILTFQTKDATPVPINLTGSAVIMKIIGDTDLSIGAGLTITGADDNQVTIETDLFTWIGRRKYELEITFPSGIVKTYLTGTIITKEQIDE